MRRLLAAALLCVPLAASAKLTSTSGSYAGGPPAFVGYPDDANSAASVGTANAAFTVPVNVTSPCPLTGFRVNQGATSGNLDIGVYTMAGTKLTSTGAKVSTGTGLQTYTLNGSTYTLNTGGYLFAIAADNTTVTFTRGGTTGLIGAQKYSTSYPLPTTITGGVVTANFFSIVGICAGGISQ